MAKSGLMQLLSTFGIDFDPAEIKAEAMKFQAIMLSIQNELIVARAERAAIARHLGVTFDGPASADPPVHVHGSGKPNGGGDIQISGGSPGDPRPALSRPAQPGDLRPAQSGDLRPAPNGTDG